jgi:SAM-dependent methyltransferase
VHSTLNRAQVDPSNIEQARAWDGDEGTYWAANAERFDALLAAIQDPFMETAAIGSTEQVLDIGCGTGRTSRDAARAAASGAVLGIDLSSQMIDLARSLAAAEGVANARFMRGDAQIYPFEPEAFDIAISRAGATFFGDPVAGFRNIAGALRPGGRLALLASQALPHNEWLIELFGALAGGRDLPAPSADAPGPFAFADPDRVRAVLGTAGFQEVRVDGLSAPMYLGSDASDACGFVLGLFGWLLNGLEEAGRARAVDALRTTLTAHQTGHGVTYNSSVWIVTGHKPAR